MLDSYILTSAGDDGEPRVRAFVIACQDGFALVRPMLGDGDRLVSLKRIRRDYDLWPTSAALLAEHELTEAELLWLTHWVLR